MNFDKFLRWLKTNFQEAQKIRTLGDNSYFKARIHDDGNQLFFEYGTKEKCGCLTIDKIKLIWDRYMSLGGTKEVTSKYTDPEWTKSPNRVLAPYAAALIRDFANKPLLDLEIQVDDGIKVDEWYGTHQTGAGTESVRIADSKGHTYSADLDSNMSTKLSIEGDSRQGESGTIEVCGILVRRLNKDGFSWESPYDPTADISRREEGIDCEAKDREKVLKVQVTRVETDIWKDLSKNQKAGKISKIKCTVENIWNVILRKSNRIPPDQRKDLVLALDAIETPIYALENVVEAFGNKYGAKTTSLGYEAVWMVGPTEELTYRLDCKIVAQSF